VYCSAVKLDSELWSVITLKIGFVLFGLRIAG
jgi:hypothetical protein